MTDRVSSYYNINRGESMALRATLYIDGSCRSHHGSGAGKIGYGIHGYLYQSRDPSSKIKPMLAEDYHVTNRGYIHKTKDLGASIEVIEPVKYIDGFGSSLDAATNNVAELRGLLTALKKTLELQLQEIYVLTDSEYVKRGVKEWLPKWLQNNWMKHDGNPVGNQDLWKQVHEHLVAITKAGIEIDIDWIRAHDDNQGNVQADLLASIGCNYSFHSELIDSWVESEPKGYWKKEVEKHPFLNFRRVYFNSLSQFNTPGHYYQADPGGNDFIIGKRLPETGYSVIKLKEPDQIIEAVKQKQFDVSRSLNAIYLLKLDNAHHKSIYPYIRDYGKYSLHKFKKNNNLVFIDDANTPITTEINPTGLSLRAVDSFNFLEEILDKFIHYRDRQEDPYTDAFKIQAHDVTEIYYDITDKGYALKPEFIVGFRDMYLSVQRESKDFKIPVILGTDMPPRNNLKRLEDYKPKITLVTYTESEKSFRYCVIIECENAIGIWSNYYASCVFIC